MKSLGRVLLYITGGLLLLTGALAQQKISPPAKPGQGSTVAKQDARKSEVKKSDEKKSPGKAMTKDFTANLENCSGPNIEADHIVTFVAKDKPYEVVLTNNVVFTDCEAILHLKNVGDKQSCTANLEGLKPGQFRHSLYMAIPPHGSKDCPNYGSTKKGKKLGGGSDPSDITVP